MKKVKSTKDLSFYHKLNYRIIFEFDPDDNVFVVKFPELPGCIAHGRTEKEALTNALKAKTEWLATAFQEGVAIPEPAIPIDTSGRITLRIPKSTHKKLIERAEQENSSLNQLILTYVAEGLERSNSKDILNDLITEALKVQRQITLPQEQKTISVILTTTPQESSGWMQATSHFTPDLTPFAYRRQINPNELSCQGLKYKNLEGYKHEEYN